MLHRDLAAELARGEAGHIALPTRANGSALDADALGEWFANAIDAAGLPDDCVLHGLRKTAAKALAEAGCTAHEIAAVTGDKTLAEIERYTKGASQRTAQPRRFTSWRRTRTEQELPNVVREDCQTDGQGAEMIEFSAAAPLSAA